VSDPRAIAQVTTAASAVSGAGVTLDVSDASLFVLGQLLELYPSQYGDGAPLARAGQTVRFQVSAKAGATLTGVMNPDGYPNPPRVEKGWIADGRAGAGASGLVRNVDGVDFPRTWQGIYDAAEAGAGKVIVSPGPAIPFSASPATGGYVRYVDDLTIDLQDTEITMVVHGNPTCFSMNGQGPVGAALPLSFNSIQAQNYVELTTANINALVTAGLRVGDVVQIYQDPGSAAAGDVGCDLMLTRVWSINAAGGAIYISPPTIKPFLIASNAKLTRMSLVKRAALLNARFDGADISQPNEVFVAPYWCEDCVVENVRGRNSYGFLVQAPYPSFGTRLSHVGGSRLAIASAIGAVQASYFNSGLVEDIHLDAPGIGLKLDGFNHSVLRSARAYSGSSRGVRLLQARMNAVDGILTSGVYGGPPGASGLSGFALAGDSVDNVVTGLVAENNPEAGVLLTQVPGSTFVVRDNYIQGRSVGNYVDVWMSGDIRTNDLDIKAALYTDASNLSPNSGNSFGDDVFIAYPYAAGSYTASAGTWQPLVGQVIQHNYIQRRKRMTILVLIQLAAPPSAAVAELRQRIPNGRLASAAWRGSFLGADNGVNVSIIAFTTAGQNYVSFVRADGLNWTGLGTVTISGQLTIGVQ